MFVCEIDQIKAKYKSDDVKKNWIKARAGKCTLSRKRRIICFIKVIATNEKFITSAKIGLQRVLLYEL